MPIWLLTYLFKFSWIVKLVPHMKTLLQFWREALIVILIVIISFGYAHYTSTITDMGIELQNTKTNFTNAKANTILLEDYIDELDEQIVLLELANNVLEENVLEANTRITELQAIGPEVVVKTVYEQVLPEQCFGKFDWMLNEAIRMQGEEQ